MGKDCTDDMITSSANQQMKHLSQLMKRAKERKKEQVFVVEGIKMFQEAPADTVVSVYVSESFLEKPEHEKCLQGYRYEVVSDAVFREIWIHRLRRESLRLSACRSMICPIFCRGITRIF